MIPTNFKSYDQAIEWLNLSLPSMPKDVFRGDFGLQRVKHLLNLLGDPQDSFRSIHIAGTSGKGSVAYLCSAGLVKTGTKVGLSVSPYVYDIRERFQINGEFAQKDLILEAANQLLPHLRKLHEPNQLPSVYEVYQSLTMLIFALAEVDYAVIETGLGGLLDASNTITRADKVCVITTIGYDHVEVLGETIEEIANQKAGIIGQSNHVFVAKAIPEVTAVIEKVVVENNAKLHTLESVELNIENHQLQSPTQKANAGLAYQAVSYVARRDDLDFSKLAFEAAASQVYLPGRFEVVDCQQKTVIFDGSHNPQKLKALAQSLQGAFPNQKFQVVMILNQQKQAEHCLEIIAPFIDKLYLSDYPKKIAVFKQAVSEAESLNWAADLGIEAEYEADYLKIASKMKSSPDQNWLITGSFYHLDDLRKVAC